MDDQTAHPENDLENILEMEDLEQQPEVPLLDHAARSVSVIERDPYEWDMARSEIDNAVEEVQNPRPFDSPREPQIRVVEDDTEIIELPDNSPEIIAYIDDWGRRIPLDDEPQRFNHPDTSDSLMDHGEYQTYRRQGPWEAYEPIDPLNKEPQ